MQVPGFGTKPFRPFLRLMGKRGRRFSACGWIFVLLYCFKSNDLALILGLRLMLGGAAEP